MKTILFLFLALAIVLPANITQAGNKEGVIGAATGGVAGGVIGHQSGNKTEGAILGTIAGYAIGTNIHRQKQRQKQVARQLERERAQIEAARLAYEQQVAAQETPPPFAPSAPAIPELTASERQQLLLQATPLFQVRRGD